MINECRDSYFSSWQSVIPYTTPPATASISIIPVFRDFIKKSHLQLGNTPPKIHWMQGLVHGCRAAPTIGATVGTQVTVQRLIEGRISEGDPTFTSMLSSTVAVGIISSPFLAVLNGQTLGRSVSQSIRLLSAKQVGAIVTREISFLFSLRVSEPVSQTMKKRYGDKTAVMVTACYFTGFFGSMIGHPADTALTLWQKNVSIVKPYHLFRGGLTKSHAVGKFTVLYGLINKFINSH
ncbi:MAG: hypothetical protein VX777_08460 [Chlamydiota bacterium]|nr:hypothetical protein [Chlamydiota bacterium]